MVLLLLFAALEIGARVYISWTRGSYTAGLQERTIHLSYEPFVMFGPGWDQKLAANRQPRKPGTCRILLVGGSTAAFFLSAVLEKAFSEAHGDSAFEVINGAFGAYAARQEVIVATLWGPELHPDLLMSLDGANDLTLRLRGNRAGAFFLDSAYNLYLTQPWLGPFVYLLSQSQLVNGVLRLAARGRMGPADQYADAIAPYIDAQHSLNVLAPGAGARRLMVLQPFSGFKRPHSPSEQAFDLFKYREPVMMVLLNEMADKLNALATRDQASFLDGRFAFQRSEETVFTDDVHLTEIGYRMLASKVASHVANERLLEPVSCGTVQ
ncbi:MAG: hypothetical protein OER43_11000 [Gammaproteobacteria bacterium]|nr:hypothetical protein [Gammaproteobacteria bacterium]MDH3411903.1 hypothetical protein [Gammaproteobacteria bacterium]